MTPIQHDESVTREFDRAAKRYDDALVVRSYQRRAQLLVVDRLRTEPGMHILDLGCGTGRGSLDIAARLHGTGSVFGLDLSPKMIEQASKNLVAAGYRNVAFQVGTASWLDFDDEFDAVLSTNAFHHFADKAGIFRRVWRSLKQGGCFVVQDICVDYLRMRILDLAGKISERAHVGSTRSDQLRSLYRSAGFVHVEVERRKLGWFWGIMIGKGVK